MAKQDHVAGLAIQIPEDMIKDVILAKVAEALPHAEIWVAQIVKHAMSQKNNSYNKQTIFEETINQQIREMANLVFKEWLLERKEEIKKQLVAELSKRNSKRLKDVASLLVDSMTTISVHGIKLGVDDGY